MRSAANQTRPAPNAVRVCVGLAASESLALFRFDSEPRPSANRRDCPPQAPVPAALNCSQGSRLPGLGAPPTAIASAQPARPGEGTLIRVDSVRRLVSRVVVDFAVRVSEARQGLVTFFDTVRVRAILSRNLVRPVEAWFPRDEPLRVHPSFRRILKDTGHAQPHPPAMSHRPTPAPPGGGAMFLAARVKTTSRGSMSPSCWKSP